MGESIETKTYTSIGGRRDKSLILLLISLTFAISLGYFSGKKLDGAPFQGVSIVVPESLALVPTGSTEKVLGRLGRIDTSINYPLSNIFSPTLWFPSSTILDSVEALRAEYLQSFFFRKSLEPGFLLRSVDIRLDLSDPDGFIEFSFGGNNSGAHVLRVMKDRIALLYSVLHESRIVIQEFLLTEPLGTGPIGINIGKDKLTLRYYEKPIYNFSEKGIAAGSVSIATNLKEKDFISLVVGSLVGGKESKDICF